jgi:tetratricopeptide (TPR) repeat protein
MKKIISLILCSFLVFSCSSKSKDHDTAEYAYTEAMKKLKDKRYAEAAESFEKIDDDYPLSKWSIKAQVIAAYAHYKEENFVEVIRVCDDFIRLNPANSNVANHHRFFQKIRRPLHIFYLIIFSWPQYRHILPYHDLCSWTNKKKPKNYIELKKLFFSFSN